MPKTITKALSKLSGGLLFLVFLQVFAATLAFAQVLLTASSARALLCAIAVCPAAKPAITGYDITSVFTPGGKFVLQGTNFNSPHGQPGALVFKIGSKADTVILRLGHQGFRQPYLERQTTVLGWADSHVFGQIPLDVSGVMDGFATLEVWRDDGVKSDPFVIHFTATKDFQILPMTDVTVKTCSTAGDTNLCNNWSDSSQLTIPANVYPTPSVYSAHALFIPLSNNTQSGQDYFTFSLQNGWTFDNTYLGENGAYDSASGCNHYLANADLPSPSRPGELIVDWTTSCNIQYHLSLHIAGPKGVPWK